MLNKQSVLAHAETSCSPLSRCDSGLPVSSWCSSETPLPILDISYSSPSPSRMGSYDARCSERPSRRLKNPGRRDLLVVVIDWRERCECRENREALSDSSSSSRSSSSSVNGITNSDAIPLYGDCSSYLHQTLHPSLLMALH